METIKVKTTKNKIVQVLIEARELISKPENHTKGAFARDSDDLPTSFISNSACKFCSIGAIFRAVDDLYGDSRLMDSEIAIACLSDLKGARDALSKGVPLANKNPMVYNDSPEATHQDILEMFTRAIEIESGTYVSESVFPKI